MTFRSKYHIFISNMSDYDLPIEIKAQKIIQPTLKGQNLYLAKLPVGLLINEREFKVDLWKKDKGLSKDQGYQRTPSRPRLLKISQFIEKDDNPIFPTTILLSSREKLDFKADVDSDEGFLTIRHPLWIVDGQHRIYGLRLAIQERGLEEWNEMELPVVILDNFNKDYETLQFFVLNTTQKRVPTDLAQQLLRKVSLEKESSSFNFRPGDQWISKALQIVDLLNDMGDSDNVWCGRVKPPNQKKLPAHIINQTSFVASLKPLLKDGGFQAIPSDTAYQILKNYWAAIKSLLPDVFADPKRYVMQKTPGTFAMNDLANRIITRGMMGNVYKIDSFSEVLKDIFVGECGNESYWRAKSDGAALYNSMGAFNRLANMLERNIPEGKTIVDIKV